MDGSSPAPSAAKAKHAFHPSTPSPSTSASCGASSRLRLKRRDGGIRADTDTSLIAEGALSRIQLLDGLQAIFESCPRACRLEFTCEIAERTGTISSRHQPGNPTMKCALCHAKKGKRACKLTSTHFICPSCCASARRDECVGCDYYENSLVYQRERQIRNKAFVGIDLHTYIRNKRVFDRAFTALHEKRFQAAIDLFEQVLAAEKGHVQSYGNMGLAYAGLGKRQKALECLNKAIDLDPEYEPAIINRFAVERLKDGEAMPDVVVREVDYYADFKVPGRSHLGELAKELGSTGKGLSSRAHSEE
jgi:hypothetical protein